MSVSTDRSAFVRKYNPATDLEAAVHIFRETSDASLKVEPIWTIGSYIWCRPYLLLNPDTCFVLDDGNGKAVGYIFGATHSGIFCERWENEYLPVVDQELRSLPPLNDSASSNADSLATRRDNLINLIRNDPRKLVLGSYSGDLEHLGHLHIDILPSHQRQGFGKLLIDALLSALTQEGCRGIYLGMVASNHGAARFYEAYGFKRLPKVLDDGLSGELGRTAKGEDGGEKIYFVIDLRLC